MAANLGERIVRFKLDFGDSQQSTEQVKSRLNSFEQAVLTTVKGLAALTLGITALGIAYKGLMALLRTDLWITFGKTIKDIGTYFQAFRTGTATFKEFVAATGASLLTLTKSIKTSLVAGFTSAWAAIKAGGMSVVKTLEDVHKSLTVLEAGVVTLLGPIGKFIIRMQELSVAAAFVSPKMAILFGSIAAGATAAVYALGALIQSIGQKLTDVTNKWLEVGLDFEKQQFGLTVAVRAFNKSTLEAAISSEDLIEKIRRIAVETGVAATDIKQGVNVMFEMSRVTKLTGDQIDTLVKSMADFSVVRGVSFQEVVYAIDQAFRGWHQSASALGLTLDDSSVSALAATKGWGEAGRVAGQSAAVTQRYKAALEQLELAHNAGRESAEKFAFGGIRKLQGELQTIEGVIGLGVAKFWQPFYNILATTAKLFRESLGESVLQNIGYFTALSATIIKIGGYVVKLTVLISFLTAAFILFNTTLGITGGLLNGVILKGFANFIQGLEVLAKAPFLTKALTPIIESMTAISGGANSASGALKGLAGWIGGVLARSLGAFLFAIAPVAIALTAFTLLIRGTMSSYDAMNKETDVVAKGQKAASDSVKILNQQLANQNKHVADAVGWWDRLAEAVGANINPMDAFAAIIQRIQLLPAQHQAAEALMRARGADYEKFLKENPGIRQDRAASRPGLLARALGFDQGQPITENITETASTAEIREHNEELADFEEQTRIAGYAPTERRKRQAELNARQKARDSARKEREVTRARELKNLTTPSEGNEQENAPFRPFGQGGPTTPSEQEIQARIEYLKLSGRYQEAIIQEQRLMEGRFVALQGNTRVDENQAELIKDKTIALERYNQQLLASIANEKLPFARAISREISQTADPRITENILFARTQEARKKQLLDRNVSEKDADLILLQEKKRFLADKDRLEASELEGQGKLIAAFEKQMEAETKLLQTQGTSKENIDRIIARKREEFANQRAAIDARILTDQGRFNEAFAKNLEVELQSLRFQEIKEEDIQKIRTRKLEQELQRRNQLLRTAIHERQQIESQIQETALQEAGNRPGAAREAFARNMAATQAELQSRLEAIETSNEAEEVKATQRVETTRATAGKIRQIEVQLFQQLKSLTNERYNIFKDSLNTLSNLEQSTRDSTLRLRHKEFEADMANIDARRDAVQQETKDRLFDITQMQIDAIDKEKLITIALQSESEKRKQLINEEISLRKKAIESAAQAYESLIGMLKKPPKDAKDNLLVAMSEFEKLKDTAQKAVTGAALTGDSKTKRDVEETVKKVFEEKKQQFTGKASDVFGNVNQFVKDLNTSPDQTAAGKGTRGQIDSERQSAQAMITALNDSIQKVSQDILDFGTIAMTTGANIIGLGEAANQAAEMLREINNNKLTGSIDNGKPQTEGVARLTRPARDGEKADKEGNVTVTAFNADQKAFNKADTKKVEDTSPQIIQPRAQKLETPRSPEPIYNQQPTISEKPVPTTPAKQDVEKQMSGINPIINTDKLTTAITTAIKALPIPDINAGPGLKKLEGGQGQVEFPYNSGSKADIIRTSEARSESELGQSLMAKHGYDGKPKDVDKSMLDQVMKINSYLERLGEPEFSKTDSGIENRRASNAAGQIDSWLNMTTSSDYKQVGTEPIVKPAFPAYEATLPVMKPETAIPQPEVPRAISAPEMNFDEMATKLGAVVEKMQKTFASGVAEMVQNMESQTPAIRNSIVGIVKERLPIELNDEKRRSSGDR